jgi:hypothetical protein
MHSADPSSSGIAVHDSANCEATLPTSSPPTIALAENSQTSDFFSDAGSEHSYGVRICDCALRLSRVTKFTNLSHYI